MNIYKNQFNFPNRLQLYKTSFLIGYNSICKVDTCYNRDVRPYVSKLDSKSLKCIFLGYSRIQKGYRCYCPSLCRYLLSADVAFLENSYFSHPIHISQRKDDDLLVYTLAS